MNHRASFKVAREDSESDASIRNAVTNTQQMGDRSSMNKDFEVSAIESQRACKNISRDVQLARAMTWKGSIRGFAHIYAIFVSPQWNVLGKFGWTFHTRCPDGSNANTWRTCNLNFRNRRLPSSYTNHLLEASVTYWLLFALCIKFHYYRERNKHVDIWLPLDTSQSRIVFRLLHLREVRICRGWFINTWSYFRV